jgi:3-methyladenine DNA glycosylase/8-oxoguanine DNA glycosylase
MKELNRALKHLAKVDKRLAKVIEASPKCDLAVDADVSPYQALVRSIVYQQLHGKAAATILARVKALFEHGETPTPRELLEMSEERLRGAGLSRSKMLAMKDLAAKTLEGVVPSHDEILKLSDEEIIERLCRIRGIGEWTVQMMLMFKLGRLDVMASTDYGVRAGFALTYRLKEMPKPSVLAEFGERWKPYRSVACWYMWRSVDLDRERAKKLASPKGKKAASKASKGAGKSAGVSRKEGAKRKVAKG